MYLLSVPSVFSRYFNKIKRTSYLGKMPALSQEILRLSHFQNELLHQVGSDSKHTDLYQNCDNVPRFIQASLSKTSSTSQGLLKVSPTVFKD